MNTPELKARLDEEKLERLCRMLASVPPPLDRRCLEVDARLWLDGTLVVLDQQIRVRDVIRVLEFRGATVEFGTTDGIVLVGLYEGEDVAVISRSPEQPDRVWLLPPEPEIIDLLKPYLLEGQQMPGLNRRPSAPYTAQFDPDSALQA